MRSVILLLLAPVLMALPQAAAFAQCLESMRTVGEGETLRVRLTTGSDDASNEIFLRYGLVPDGYNYDATYQKKPVRAL